jgi:acetyl esterase/lipase
MLVPMTVIHAIAAWVLLWLSLVGAWLAWNTYRPLYGRHTALLSFFTGWLTAELALHHVAFQALITALLVRAGALELTIGWIGLWISLASWAALLWGYFFEGRTAEHAVERALCEGLGADYRSRIRPELAARFAPRIDWKPILMPFPMRHRDVERIRDIPYHRARGITLKLDVYRNRSRPQNCPVLLEIHGGGWVVGSKNQQGIPMMLRMAAQGWMCVSANYRLSPHATFPEHLIDLKHAIRWIREHAAEYGGDPDFVIVAGQSAGGHLASLLALTPNQPELQPGIENVDTRVRGCVSFYGVYDFTDRYALWRNPELARLLEEQVLKTALDEDREAYEKASPMSHVSPDDPPFLVIHGNRDSLVPVEEARRFVDLMRAVTRKPIVYAEIHGAQHAFEIFPSLRGVLVLSGVERFLAYLHSEHLAERAGNRSADALSA